MLQTYTHFNIKEMLRDFDIKRKKTRKKKTILDNCRQNI